MAPHSNGYVQPVESCMQKSHYFPVTLSYKRSYFRTVNNYLLVRSVWPFLSILNKAAAKIPRKLNEVIEGVFGTLNPWTRCVRSVSGIFGFPLGKLYVDRHFDDHSKEVVNAMINAVKASFNRSLDDATWMDEGTRSQAKAKLAAISNLVGYPDYFTNETQMQTEWGGFNFSTADYFGNLAQIQQTNYLRAVEKLDEQMRLEFVMTPQSINAYYSPSSNVIAFPAGILQPPFYQQQFPVYISYGAIGTVIGHEITHGFDDDGRNFDKDGNQRQWWSNATAAAFQTAAECIARQYESFKVDGDVRVRGSLVLGESIADNGGLKNAFRAYKSLQLTEPNNGASEIRLPYLNDHYSNEQLLFIAYSQIWCELETSQSLRQSVKLDPHPPGKMRVWGPISNSEEFSQAFKCKPGDRMNPKEKCTVWG